jgi:hypothetical protein
MPQTPDRKPGPLQELEEIQLLTPAGSAPSVSGGMVYDPGIGSFQFRDATGTFDPRSGGAGLTPTSHRFLDQLVHALAEDCYMEVTRTSGQISSVTYWEDATKAKKVRETTLTRSGGQVSQIVVVQYDSAGSAVETMTGTVARVSGQVSTITWALT